MASLEGLLRRLAAINVAGQMQRGRNVFGVPPRPVAPKGGELYMPRSYEEAANEGMRALQIPGTSYVSGRPLAGNPLPDSMTIEDAAGLFDAIEQGAILRSSPAMGRGGLLAEDALSTTQFAQDFGVSDNVARVLADRADSMALNDAARYGTELYDTSALPEGDVLQAVADDLALPVDGVAARPDDVVGYERPPETIIRPSAEDSLKRDLARTAAAAGLAGAGMWAANQWDPVDSAATPQAASIDDIIDSLPTVDIPAPDFAYVPLETPGITDTGGIDAAEMMAIHRPPPPSDFAMPDEMSLEEYVAEMKRADGRVGQKAMDYMRDVASRMRRGSNPRVTAIDSGEGDYIFSPDSIEGRAERRVGKGLSRAARLQGAAQ